MGAYPRDTGSNSVEGNGHFFPSYRQLYLSSFSDTPSSDSAEVLADAWRRGPADRSWSVSCMIVSRSSWRMSVSRMESNTSRSVRPVYHSPTRGSAEGCDKPVEHEYELFWFHFWHAHSQSSLAAKAFSTWYLKRTSPPTSLALALTLPLVTFWNLNNCNGRSTTRLLAL